MSLLLSLLFSITPAYAEIRWIHLSKPIGVYVQANPRSAILLTAGAGEKVAVHKRGHSYTKIQIKRSGKWRVGYVLNSDLDEQATPLRENSESTYALGLAGVYSKLHHAGKTFSTEDQVQYTTTEFTSSSFAPTALVQFGRKGFWRIFFSNRHIAYKSSTVTDVGGGTSRPLEIAYSMYSLVGQRVWTPFSKPSFYFGLGIEISHATSAKLKIGGSEMPIESKDLPTYFGAQGLIGWQMDLARRISMFSELRGISYFNQKPVIYGIEVAAGLMYWP